MFRDEPMHSWIEVHGVVTVHDWIRHVGSGWHVVASNVQHQGSSLLHSRQAGIQNHTYRLTPKGLCHEDEPHATHPAQRAKG